MALSDISLTAGMRSNLVNLQQTVSLLDRTQTRLATGKKVNTALDNPTAFFAAQALDARANDIDSLKSDMGQSIQTIQAADKGIKGISSLIEQARGIAQQAQASSTTASSYATGTITLASAAAADTVTVAGQTFTATAAGTPGTGEFYIGGNNNMDAEALAIAINANTTVTGLGFSASASNGVVTISNSAADVTAANVTTSSGTTLAEAVVAADTDLSALQDQYNEIRSQIDTMALDSGYKGKNLLNADTLTVKFEGTHTLDVVGFSASSASLGITAASWTLPANASADVDRLITALSTLRSESSAMSSNLSIITTRQSFSTEMVNVLTEGSGKLTLADTNEEGANMLMLQTRQSLSTTALSLASQAAQSVLRLFG
ncbi:MAG: hypothetical protein HZA15_11745 [Nitrospirae bacterium]|nr:hypothetical protein [Nitrospirota bacterium]